MRSYPKQRQKTVTSNSLILHLDIDENLDDFKGHFDGFPILPGATQLDWVMHFATQLHPEELCFAGADIIKFQQPIFPNQVVILHIEFNEETQKIIFSYTDEQQNIYSKGKLKLDIRHE